MSFYSTYDALLFDLDGTVWLEGEALPHAVETINAAPIPSLYITNNASRSPATVASMLEAMGIPTREQQVITSAQAAIRLAQAELPAGSAVFVVGSEAFKELAEAAGFRAVASADDAPAAVFHGHNPETGWALLSEAALAIQTGAKYFASNLDATLPTPRGFCVGNGSMVQAVVHATGVQPVSAGKPSPAMFHVAAEQVNAQMPLALGDRLDTDIAGAVAAGQDSFHVLTGVSKHYALLRAPESQRPTFVADDLSALADSPEQVRVLPQAATAGTQASSHGGFEAEMLEDALVLRGGGSEGSATAALRAALACAWTYSPDGFMGSVLAEGEYAAAALEQWV